jgi:TolA-binding protein
VFDPLVRSKKNLVESAAYLELARIFRSMGLLKGAKEKVVEGVMRTRDVIRLADAIPLDLRQQGYKLTWELYIAGDDFANAMSTCHLFNRLYPDSPIVDEALMGMARIRMENRQYTDAVSLFRQVLGLARSDAKGEAQFRIGEATEAMASSRRGDDGVAQAIQEYKICAERYPDSPFAADAIAKVVDYYIAARDFAQAGILLEQVFTDHPDAAFLDSMLLKWTLVAYQSGDYAKARDKCAQLISEYPESSHAQKAKQILPKIEAKLNQASGGAAAGASQTGDRP